MMGTFSWYGLTIRTKVVMTQQKYEAITGVHHRADTTIYTQTMQKLTSCQFLDDAKIITSCQKS